jgi:predicted lipid-binding transport protein (Tim44 family)
MTKLRRLAAALACLSLAASIVLVPTLADARAGGTTRSTGGTSYSSQGSRGSRTYDNNGAAPMQRSLTPREQPSSPSSRPGYAPYGQQPSFAQQHPFLTGLAGGFLGSWIGSLLFPHWGGYGMGYGGGFGGVLGSLILWMLIIGGVWWLIRSFRGRSGPLTVPELDPTAYRRSEARPAFGGGGGAARGQEMQVSQADFQAFEAILKAVQGAWSKGDLGGLRHYVTPEMLSYFAEQLAENESQGVTNRVEQVELVQGDLREAWDEGRLQYATAYLRWRALDYTVRSDRRPGEPGWVVEGDPQRPTEAAEVWTFARSPGGHWLLSAIQQV